VFEITWGRVKAFLNYSNRMEEYVYHLAQYTLAARCRSENVDQFKKLIDIVSSIYWRNTPTLLQSADTTLPYATPLLTTHLSLTTGNTDHLASREACGAHPNTDNESGSKSHKSFMSTDYLVHEGRTRLTRGTTVPHSEGGCSFSVHFALLLQTILLRRY